MALIDHQSGTVMFAAPDDAQAIVDAKAYCQENNLSYEHFKIVRRDKQILVLKK